MTKGKKDKLIKWVLVKINKRKTWAKNGGRRKEKRMFHEVQHVKLQLWLRHQYGDDIKRRTLNLATQKSWEFLTRIISVEFLRWKPDWSNQTSEQRSDRNSQISSHSEFSSSTYFTAVNLCPSQSFKWSVSSLTLSDSPLHSSFIVPVRMVLPNHKSDQLSPLSKTLHCFPVSPGQMAESFIWPSRPSISYSCYLSGFIFHYLLFSHSLNNHDLLTHPQNSKRVVPFSLTVPSILCTLLLDTLVVNFLAFSWSLFKHHLFWESFPDNPCEMRPPLSPFPFYIFFLFST